jgi:ketosteroid isomerase-like protein
MLDDTESLRNLYDAFNRREIEAVIALMQPDVKWANGMEGGFVYGRDAVREYWTRQFTMINPQLEPLEFITENSGRRLVKVHQIVHDLQGRLLLDKTVEHIFTIENGRIKTFEIGEEK